MIMSIQNKSTYPNLIQLMEKTKFASGNSVVLSVIVIILQSSLFFSVVDQSLACFKFW